MMSADDVTSFNCIRITGTTISPSSKFLSKSDGMHPYVDRPFVQLCRCVSGGRSTVLVSSNGKLRLKCDVYHFHLGTRHHKETFASSHSRRKLLLQKPCRSFKHLLASKIIDRYMSMFHRNLTNIGFQVN